VSAPGRCTASHMDRLNEGTRDILVHRRLMPAFGSVQVRVCTFDCMIPFSLLAAI
jgi:hypothetical protein